ncbi:MAG TPA: alpha/beta fold hydrolase [Longimicrobiaceae bacterium]|nr:alpha/beta fold hydrolase [Longimicrobiaceae bacterium]
MQMTKYRNRFDAGRQLAQELERYASRPDVMVLALPRGGVPVGFEVARALDAPLDVFLVRKLGVPGHEELAMGAIASGGVRILSPGVIRSFGITETQLAAATAAEQSELARREREYRGDRPEPDVRGRTVILVDDGLATGASMRAAVEALRAQGPRSIVVAVPVAAEETCDALRDLVDEVVCGMTPEPFYAVGLWYDEFTQTTDDEVRALLREADEPQAGPPTERAVRVTTAGVTLDGDLVVPAAARGVVLFAHGSGSSRHSPRNRYVAGVLQEAGLATLLLDLLTPEEEMVDLRTAQLRFDIDLLCDRLVGATDWLLTQLPELPIGYFGASTGGGAALAAAAERPDAVAAVVSRGGRPDLAGEALTRVHAPTLLIVGGDDAPVIAMNRAAMAQMGNATVEMEIVPGATHLFEEPGKLERVARLARDWLLEHLG